MLTGYLFLCVPAEKILSRWPSDATNDYPIMHPQTGLFSATVAAFLVGTYQTLQPSSQDTSTFYLATIAQILAVSTGNGSQTTTPISLPPLPPNPTTFRPPRSAIWYNSLWFSSLVLSLTCALLATSLQQWARRYLRVTQPRYGPHKRARIRAFFAEGIEKLHLPWAVEALPALLHVSVFLFFAGLIVFLATVHHTVFSAVLCCMALCIGLYLCITLFPIFRHDSPYYTPLTTIAWFCATGISWVVLRTLKAIASELHGRKLVSLDGWYKISVIEYRQSKRFFRGFTRDTEDIAFRLPTDIDVRGLSSTFNSLEEDNELEEFLAGIPGFLSSHEVTDPANVLKEVINRVPAMAYTVFLFIERTFSSGLVSEAIQARRKSVYMRAIDLVTPLLPVTFYQALHFWDSDHYPAVNIFGSIDFWLLAEAHSHDDDPDVAISAQCMAAAIATSVQERDQRWFNLVRCQLDISEDVLQTYLDHGDSVLLANLIHIVERLTPTPHNNGADGTHNHTLNLDGLIRHTLRIARKFEVAGTLPELRDRFCALWNRITLVAHDCEFFSEVERRHARTILRVIRTVYIALHDGTDSRPTAFSSSTQSLDPILWDESSYPICLALDHHHSSPFFPDVISCVSDKDDRITLQINPGPIASSPVSISPILSEEEIPPEPTKPSPHTSTLIVHEGTS